MRIVHIELKDANDFVAKHHRHHKPVVGHRFSIGAEKNNKLVGVCIVGRPVARMICQKSVLEVLRLCTDGTSNACSFLYSAAYRAGKALGYAKIQTYILCTEPGTSLLASGWVRTATTSGGDWNRPSRKGRRIDQPTISKIRYEKDIMIKG